MNEEPLLNLNAIDEVTKGIIQNQATVKAMRIQTPDKGKQFVKP